jgi:methionyl-tRNA formyltransferase
LQTTSAVRQGLPVLRSVRVGCAAFGEKTRERLPASEAAVAVDPSKVRAEGLGLPAFQRRSFRGEGTLREFSAHWADLAVLAGVRTILSEPAIRLPRFGKVCFHPSSLPRYPGGSAIHGRIVPGERRGSVTVFRTDTGIDAGPSPLQREIETGPHDTAGSLYYRKLFPLGIGAIEEAVPRIGTGRAPGIPQDETRGSCELPFRDEDVARAGSRSPRENHDSVRGAGLKPGARARLRSGTDPRKMPVAGFLAAGRRAAGDRFGGKR